MKHLRLVMLIVLVANILLLLPIPGATSNSVESDGEDAAPGLLPLLMPSATSNPAESDGGDATPGLLSLPMPRATREPGCYPDGYCIVVPLPTPSPPSDQRCFPQTGQCISGTIRDYWERHGGPQVFGYPISDVREEQVVDTIDDIWSGPVQWFERDRLEDHSADGLGVLAGRLGASMLELQERDWEGLSPVRVDQAPPGCRFFAKTGHSLCGAFLRTWQTEGGLARFGYPLTEPFEETLMRDGTVWTGTVQYFERRRMELHPELAGTPYEISFGLLGRDMFAFTSYLKCPSINSPLSGLAGARGYSCAVSLPRLDLPIAFQRFERGEMVWVSAPALKAGSMSGTIYVIYRESRTGELEWQSYRTFWQEGMALPQQSPPPGRYAPVRAFGWLWSSEAAVQRALGWATGPEQADRGHTQHFRVNSGSFGLTVIVSQSAERSYFLHEEPFSPGWRDSAEIVRQAPRR